MAKTGNQIRKSTGYSGLRTGNKKRKTGDEIRADLKAGKYDFSLVKSELEKQIRLDTFVSDLSSMGQTIEDSYNGWQTQETMQNTRASMESMQDRLRAYKEYNQLFGGGKNSKDITKTIESYGKVLDGWDGLSGVYGKYTNAEAYTTEKTKLNELYSMNSKQLKGKKGVAYTTADGYNIKWEDLYNDAYSKEYEADIDKMLDVSKSGTYKKKDAKLSKTWNGYAVIGDEDAYLYNYVNGDKEARDYGTLTNVHLSGTYDFLKNKHLTEDEKKRFNALWETQGPEKAKEYLGLLDSDLRQRRVDYENSFYSQMAKENPVGTSVVSVLDNLGNNALALPFMAMDYAEDGSIDPNSSLYTGRRRVQTERSTIENEVIDSDTGKFFYRHGMNIADNLASRAVALGMGTGAASQFLMSSGAAVDTVLDAKKRGLSEGQALSLGAISGAAEWFFESKGFESWVDTKSLKRSAWKYFTNNLKTELVGEIFTEGTNDIADYFIAQDVNKLDTEYQSLLSSGLSEKEAFLKVVSGVASRYADVAAGTILSTGVMAGPGATIGGIQQHSQNKNIGQAIKDNEKVADVFDLAAISPEASLAYETYSKYAKRGINADNIKNAQLGNLWQSARMDKEDIAQNKNSSTTDVILAKDDYAKLGDMAKFNLEARLNDTIAKGINKESKKQKKTQGKDIDVETVKKETVDKVTERLTELGQTENVAEIANIIAKKSVGEEISAEEVKELRGSKYALQVFNENNAGVSDYVKSMDENEASLFMQTYDGNTDMEAFATSFNLVSEYAKNPSGFTKEYAIENRGVLSENTAKYIYEYVQENENLKAIRSNEELIARARKGERGILDDTVINYSDEYAHGKVQWKHLGNDEKQAIVFAKGLYKALGSNLAFVSRNKKFNGSYNVGKDITFIDVYAGKSIYGWTGKSLILSTVSHELTHEMEQKSPELFKTLSEIALSYLEESDNADYKGLDRSAIIAYEQERLKNNGHSHTEKDAISEIVARMCEDMLAESKEAKKMFESLSPSEQKTLKEKIMDIIEKVINWIDEFLAQNKEQSNSKEAKALREQKSKMEEMLAIWDKMLLDVQKYNQELEKSATDDTSSDGGMKYELREEAIAEIEKAISDKNYDNPIKLTDCSPAILVSQKGVRNLPMMITASHTRENILTEAEAKKLGLSITPDKHYHGLGKPLFLNVIDGLDGVTRAYRGTKNAENLDRRENYFLLISQYKDAEGDTINVPVYINKGTIYNEVYTPNNKVATVYGKKALEAYIQREIKKGNLVRIKNRSLQASESSPPIGDNYSKSASKDSILNPKQNVKTNFSTKDSTGRNLSEGQMGYFKDSTVRDDNGNLKVMYRGDSSEFTVFDRKKTKHSNLYGRGFYFTDSKAHAEQYGNAREFYLDIKNPLSPKQNVITKEQMLNFLKAIENDGEDYDLYNYGQGATAESVLNSVWGKGDFEMLQDINAGAIGDLVAAVELFNEVNGTTYDGIVLPTETVTFNSEQAKLTSNLNPTKDKDMRFSMRESVEETKELVAVHNMQVSELERTIDLGGLPMPSIAIIKAKSGHSEYGDVSLVFPKSTIDPKTDRNNKVYGGDAWTPVYPKIEYKPNAKVTKKINDKYYELSRKFGYDESRPLYNYVYDMEDILNIHNGESEMIAELYDDQGMMQLYLLDSGKDKVETIQKEIRTELTDAEVEMNEFFISELGADAVDEIVWDGNGTPMSYRKNYLSKYEDAIREAYKKLLTEKYQFTDEQVQNVMDSTKNADLIRFMRDAHKYRENGRVTTKTEADYEATKEAIKTAAGDGYRAWVDSLFKGIEEKSGIRNNTDYFTNSGNRRSWEALHWENNLENVVKVMKSQDNGVAAFFSGQAIWGVSAKDYRSIEEIKADAERLKQLPEDEYNQIKEGFGERFSEIARSIMDKTEKNHFIAVDNAMECIVDALRHSKTKSGLMTYLKEFQHLTVTETNVNDIVSLVTDISNMPTEYFEAKPRRAVDLNEIATAIIPDSTSDSTKKKLNDMGIKYLEYEKGNEQARLDALNSLEDLRFSDRDSEGNTLTEAQQEFFKDSKIRVSEVDGWENTITENGALFPVYHGTNSGEFYEFDEKTIGSANDRGWFGKGFYFAFTEDEASYYGSRVLKCYLNVKKPFFYSEEMGTFDGQDKGDVNFDFASFIINVADKFPKIAENVYVGVAERNSDEIIKKSFANFAKEIKDVYADDKLAVVEVDDRGEIIYQYRYSRDVDSIDAPENIKNIIKTHYVDGLWMADWLKEKGTITDAEYDAILNVFDKYDSKQFQDKWLTMQYNSKEQAEQNRLSATVQYLRDHKYSYIDQHLPHYYMMHFIGESFAEEIRKKGYDGVLQSRFGDEVVVFNSNQIKLTTNSNPTESDDIRYSDREDTNVYDIMGERDRLIKENEKLKKDFEGLKERLDIERKVTHGNYFNENQLGAVAGHLRNISNSNMDKVELMKALKDVYSFIAQTKELTWEDVYERCYRVAEKMLAESRPEVEVDYYSKQILRDIRNTRISLNDSQKAEAQHIFGKNWNRGFFGSVVITDKGTPIESMWQEWSEQYPNLFSEETTPNDMLSELYDIIGSLRDASETIVKYNSEEDTRWLANEIYNQYWNVSPIRTTADKYDKKIKLINFKHRQTMSELRKEYDSRVEKQKLADTIHYKKQMIELSKKLRERRDRDVARAKELGRERLVSYKENAERKTILQSTMGTVMSLNRKLTTNSKDVHVPDELKPVVINLLNAIDFSSKQLLGMKGTKKDARGLPTKYDIATENALSKVHSLESGEANVISLKMAIQDALELFENAKEVLNGTSKGEVDSSVAILDADMIDSIKTMIKYLDILIAKGEKTFVLQKMSTDHLKTLNGMVKSINHWAIVADKALANKHKKRISDLAIQTVEETDELGSRQEYIGAIESVKNYFNWSNLLPVNAFKRLGDGATEFFNGLRDSQDKVTFNRQEVMDFTDELFDKYKQYKPINWRTESKTFEVKLPGEKNTTKVTMPVSYIMTLYCVAKQEDAQRHLYGKDAKGNKLTYTDENGKVHDGGGMTIKGFKEGKFSLKVNKNLDNTILNESIVNQITSVLTKEQREVADALQEYMNTKGSEWGDAVSMALYGIKKFNTENYFPITVSPHTLNVDKVRDPKASMFSIINYGFTKERNPNAKQSIEIGDIFDVFANHMNMVAIYNAYALSVFDIARWYNFKTKNENGKEIGVTSSIEKAFGSGAVTYVSNLIKDLNGQHESSRLGIISKIFKNTKAAMVGNSLSVALLQPTAYLKAMVKVPPKYLIKSALYVKDFGAKKGVEKAKKYCGIALLKSQGYFETDVSANTTTKLLHDESFREKAIEWSLKGAEWADERTWGVLWNACEFEVRATRKDLKVGSQEFYQVIADKLRDVIYETQVVDSPLTKSDLMRSGDTGAKMVTMFASEITVAYNMVFEAAYDTMLDSKKYGKKEAIKRNHKNIMTTLTAYTLTSVANAALSTFVESFRYGDDDEDENKFLKKFLEDWIFIGKIPYLKELLGFSQGFSSTRTDALWLESAFKAYDYWIKAINGKDGATMKAFDNTLKSISYVFGVGVYNQWRELRALLRKIGIMD